MNHPLPLTPRTPVPASILFVGDVSYDGHLAEPLARQKLHNEVCTVAGGTEAIAPLHVGGSRRPAQQPDLILLDEALSREEVRDLLRQVKGDPVVRDMPVVMINSSRDEADSARERCPGAAAYAIGPVRFRELAKIVQTIPGSWLAIGTEEPDAAHLEPALTS